MLLDHRIPLGLNESDDEECMNTGKEEAQSMLANHTMIIGGAAFQGIWDRQTSPRLGFDPNPAVQESTELTDLVGFLPREMVNRFSSDLMILPRLTRNDYQTMIATLAEGVPDVWRKRFVEMGTARLDEAVCHQKGVRFAEEVLLAAIVAERASIIGRVPDQSVDNSCGISQETSEDSFGVF